MENPQQRSRQQQMMHSGLPYPRYDQSNAIAFSDPWGPLQSTSASLAPMTSTSMAAAPMHPLSDPFRQNSVSDPLQQMSMSDMTSRELSSHGYISTDNTYVPSSYGSSYTSQPATTASPMSNGISSGYSHDLYKGQSTLVEYPHRTNLSPYNNLDAAGIDAAKNIVGLTYSAPDRYSIPHSHRTSSTASSASYYPSSSVGSVSAASSISSTGSYGGFSGYGSIADGNDISSLAANDYDSIRPSLPRSSGMIHSQAVHPMAGQNAFMSTFNSRISTNAQKKHKCKVCDKRFTRPSSLQTHMYSHTGEKPFVCGVADCGRAFSVVSNLRRHRKVHKGLSDTDTFSNAGSE